MCSGSSPSLCEFLRASMRARRGLAIVKRLRISWGEIVVTPRSVGGGPSIAACVDFLKDSRRHPRGADSIQAVAGTVAMLLVETRRWDACPSAPCYPHGANGRGRRKRPGGGPGLCRGGFRLCAPDIQMRVGSVETTQRIVPFKHGAKPWKRSFALSAYAMAGARERFWRPARTLFEKPVRRPSSPHTVSLPCALTFPSPARDFGTHPGTTGGPPHVQRYSPVLEVTKDTECLEAWSKAQGVEPQRLLQQVEQKRASCWPCCWPTASRAIRRIGTGGAIPPCGGPGLPRHRPQAGLFGRIRQRSSFARHCLDPRGVRRGGDGRRTRGRSGLLYGLSSA
jgi:hypothetical protein